MIQGGDPTGAVTPLHNLAEGIFMKGSCSQDLAEVWRPIADACFFQGPAGEGKVYSRQPAGSLRTRLASL